MHLILFGTSACHLCEQAEQILANCLRDTDCILEHIDIAEHTEWQAPYAIRIPVLLNPKTQKELGWPFDAEEVRAFVAVVEKGI